MMNIGQAIVLSSCLPTVFIASIITSPFDRYIAPAWVYGSDKVQEENITLVESSRHILIFSNNETVYKKDHLGLGACYGAVFIVTAIPVFIIINFILFLLVKQFSLNIAMQMYDYYRDVLIYKST